MRNKRMKGQEQIEVEEEERKHANCMEEKSLQQQKMKIKKEGAVYEQNKKKQLIYL